MLLLGVSRISLTGAQFLYSFLFLSFLGIKYSEISHLYVAQAWNFKLPWETSALLSVRCTIKISTAFVSLGVKMCPLLITWKVSPFQVSSFLHKFQFQLPYHTGLRLYLRSQHQHQCPQPLFTGNYVQD